MKKVTALLILAVLFATSGAFAAGAQVFSIKTLVDQYYQQKDARELARKMFSGNLQAPPPRYCPPSGPSCVDAACEKLGHFGCDDMSEIKKVGVACRGNFDGSCLASACEQLGHFGCDDFNEIEKVARACVGNYDADCFNSVCNRLGHFGCDDMREVEEVLRTCAGN